MIRTIVITQEENWFVAKDIVCGIASQGKSIEEAMENLKEALELFFEDNPEKTQSTYPKVILTTMEVCV